MYEVEEKGMALLFSFMTMLLWGVWGISFKLSTTKYKVRFELFYVDWIVGALLVSFLLGSTLGTNSMVEGGDPDEQFWSNLIAAPAASVALCALAGFLSISGNYMLLAATELTGLSIAFPIALSFAVVGGTTINYLQTPSGNVWLISGGVILAVFANISSSLSNFFLTSSEKVESKEGSFGDPESLHIEKSHNTLSQHYNSIQKTEKTVVHTDTLESIRLGFLLKCSSSLAAQIIPFHKRRRMMGILLAMGAGLAFSVWPSLMDQARQIREHKEMTRDIYVTNYVCFFLMMVFGLMAVVLFSGLSLIGFPSLTCTHANWREYTNTRVGPWHALALTGGAVWALGTWFNLLASDAIGFTISYFMGQASVIITALLGIFVWDEYAGSSRLSKIFLLIFFLLYILAVVCISLAALY